MDFLLFKRALEGDLVDLSIFDKDDRLAHSKIGSLQAVRNILDKMPESEDFQSSPQNQGIGSSSTGSSKS